MQVFVGFALITVLWCIYGYSLAFTPGNAFIGGLSRLFLSGTFDPATGAYSTTGTFDKGVQMYELVYVAFQATFAAITCCLILGSLVERIKFSAILIFLAFWFTFCYCPVAHMVWFWPGADAYSAHADVAAVNATGGLIWQWGALDFAGGTVVHINSGVAGLVGAMVLGKRIGLGREPMAPHSVTMTMIGASLLWFGWFGFNAGSALEANGSAALAFMNTYLATACAVLSWMAVEWLMKGKPSMVGAASGAVAGLVAITPAAGNVGIQGAFVIGLCVGIVCFWGVTGLKKMIRTDDALDVFGVHALGGTFGALMTGIFNDPALGGPGQVVNWVTGATGYPGIWAQLLIQAKAVALVILWTAAVAAVGFYGIKWVMGIRVSEEEEREGLDITAHGERAYDM
jgi:Amt family ammonium transporter